VSLIELGHVGLGLICNSLMQETKHGKLQALQFALRLFVTVGHHSVARMQSVVAAQTRLQL